MDYFGQSSSLPNDQNDHYQRFDYKYHIEGIHYDDSGDWALKDTQDLKQRCKKDVSSDLYFDVRYKLAN